MAGGQGLASNLTASPPPIRTKKKTAARRESCRTSPEFTDEDLQVLKAEHGVQPWETGDFVMMPTNVECGECHAEFPVELDEN